MWDVTPEVAEILLIGYISTHTSRVGCDEDNKEIAEHIEISTHTSRVGCDKTGA